MPKLKCPDDVDEKHFDDMMASVPSGFIYQRTFLPTSTWAPAYWRHFEFRAVGKPKPGYGLKQGDTLTLACVLKFTPEPKTFLSYKGAFL